jgi:hypothetical protein
MFAFSFAEGEDNDGIIVLQHDHFDNLVQVGLYFSSAT